MNRRAHEQPENIIPLTTTDKLMDLKAPKYLHIASVTFVTFDDRAFAAASPGLWNNLPPHIRDADLP